MFLRQSWSSWRRSHDSDVCEELLSGLGVAQGEQCVAFDLPALARCLEAQLRAEGIHAPSLVIGGAEAEAEVAGCRFAGNLGVWLWRVVLAGILRLWCCFRWERLREVEESFVDPIALLSEGLADGSSRPRVHRGFLACYLAVRPELLTVVRRRIALARLEGRKLHVYVTGHSLGGALASLALLDLRVALREPAAVAAAAFVAPCAAPGDSVNVNATGGGADAALAAQQECTFLGVYTFGAPRPGNAAFRTLFNTLAPQEAFRIVARQDVVTACPPPFGFKQVGKEAWLDAAGEPTFCMSWSMRQLLPPRSRLRDHRTTEYRFLLGSKFFREYDYHFSSSNVAVGLGMS